MKKLTFKDLTLKNWEIYGKSVIKSELFFPEILRETSGEYKQTLSIDGLIAKVALIDSKYVGNIFGHPISKEKGELREYCIQGKYVNPQTIYLRTMVIDQEYQCNGYGYKLLLEFIKSAKQKGYKELTGHFRKSISLNLIKKFGGKEIMTCKNWGGSGEDFIFYKTDLTKIANSLKEKVKNPNSLSKQG